MPANIGSGSGRASGKRATFSKRGAGCVLALLLATGLLAGSGDGAAPADIVLFDAPRGAWLGDVRPGAVLVVLEERDGWRRVRIEGWVPAVAGGGDGAPAGPAPATPAEKGVVPHAEAPRVVVRGALRPDERGPGTGAVVLLIDRADAAAEARRGVDEECRAALDERAERAARLRAEYQSALGSSTNFREATSRSDAVKAEIAALEKETQGRRVECSRRVEAVLQEFALRRGVADQAGRFEIFDVPPGRYRIVAYDAGAAPSRVWSAPFEVVDGPAPPVEIPREPARAAAARG